MSAKEPCPGLCERCGAECVSGEVPYVTYHMRQSNDPTKREQFAAMALQGMLANSDANGHLADFAQRAVLAADFLIAALNKADCAR